MMLDPETRAVVLAEHQMRSDSWKRPDSDESEMPSVCHVCDKPLLPTPMTSRHGTLTFRKVTKGTRLCPECIRAGWRNAGCVVCGMPTRTWSWSSKKRNGRFRGYCPKCREEAHAAEAW